MDETLKEAPAAPVPVEPVVKPLEWEEPSSANSFMHVARSVFGDYYIDMDGGQHYAHLEAHVKPYDNLLNNEAVGGVYAAQAIAEADYQRRMSALVATPPAPAVADGWAFADLQRAHVERQEEWCPDQKPDLSFRGNELGGECGEALNVIKKLERERLGWRGSRDTVEHLAEELADVIHCTVLVAITAGIDLEHAVIDKFNSTSQKNGLATMLTASPAPATPAAPSITWHWYAGDNDERYIIGPCDSRDQALREAEDYDWETICIVEAAKEPVRLSQYFEVDSLFDELAEDTDIGDPDGDAVDIGATGAQTTELQAAVRAVIDEWQIRHKLSIDPWVFTHTRNAEELGKCPICDQRFRADDACAMDIELGICHAACLDGSPVVDLNSGEEINGPINEFVYSPHLHDKEGAQ